MHFLFLIPTEFQKAEEKGFLSERITLGIPKCPTISSMQPSAVSAVVLGTGIAIGYPLNRSIPVNMYLFPSSDSGNGPTKSTSQVSNMPDIAVFPVNL
ncbi:hypothetical protein AYI69_g8529 [Smittium culicis]|uniref:Uncharacterized protein n=1 Tax=Smittium culicis TaxID=133412 RepID=A0A1R1XIX8_9FUNG|nr:hypothetical protein AYI69_g8529 [Smittium culicis]